MVLLEHLQSDLSDIMMSSRAYPRDEPQYTADESFVNIEMPVPCEVAEPEENFSCHSVDILKPRIITRLPKELQIKPGEHLRLVCLTTVLFPTELSWFLNGQLIKSTIDGRVTFDNKNRQLFIIAIDEEFSGVITCIASNRFGCDKSKCVVNVVKKCREVNNNE
ncbi:follistatin-related protein 4-like isoform X1 [Hydractinia symbiolongicarpus]|uniref:follistatin-related protein 4-like isoform X1 n=1 Tax=Hydractinia symbiolongicarpus TaxID=13093 RepID=UPI00254A7338|nr:follistatin-related protein 4-like isoform X1 [Hydractinia symbiolongicarpus]